MRLRRGGSFGRGGGGTLREREHWWERERERERETEGERLGTVPPVGADGGEFNVILVLSASHLYIVVDSEAERERETGVVGERAVGRESTRSSVDIPSRPLVMP